MSPRALTAALKAEAARLGFDLAGATPAVAPPQIGRLRQWLSDGFAGEMRSMAARTGAYEHPRHVLPGVRSLLMLAVSYWAAEPVAAGPGQGTVARYAWGEDYHDLIRRRLQAVGRFPPPPDAGSGGAGRGGYRPPAGAAVRPTGRPWRLRQEHDPPE